MSTKILVLGGGGREHALSVRLRDDGADVVCAPGNDGIAQDVACRPVDPADPAAVVALARAEGAALVVVGPEAPLVAGVADALAHARIPCIGPGAAAARLEGSKAFAKAFMARHGIPTARAVVVADPAELTPAMGGFETPPVVKADGLAAGKGVVVAESFEEAETAARACLENGAFGDAGRRVLLEQRLVGEEVSFFALCDGTRAVTFMPAQDHKRLRDGDRGPNTGGMGAYAPAPVASEEVVGRIVDRILVPTLEGAAAEGFAFRGFLFLGLMIDATGSPHVIEYNVRFGDPEAQPLLWGLDEPLLPHLEAAAHGALRSGRLRGRPAATVVLASAGYPRSSRKGDPIEGLAAAAKVPGVKVFHAGTRRRGDRFETAGGRVLGVCARAGGIAEAISASYRAVDCIHFSGMQVRRDIGTRALARLAADDDS